MYPFQMALRAGFRADIGAVFRAKKSLLNCHPGFDHELKECQIWNLRETQTLNLAKKLLTEL